VPADVDGAFERAERRFGPVNGLIHAAAVLEPIGTILDVDPAAWLRTIQIDLYGSFLVTRAACASMKRSGGGRIVLFSGGGAATPFPRYTAYACSKVAVVRLVESVALEMAPFGIEINAVAPGFVATRMHEATLAAGSAAGDDYLERTKIDLATGGVSPDVGAEAACYFVSEAARGISGRFVAAPWDGWATWRERAEAIAGSDLFTLRRIVPRDRGETWQ
jgi:3-oxoacyl-[acyl-carrier protein] reductase